MEMKAENSESIAKKRMICPRISLAIVVRLILIAQSTIAIFITTCIMDSWEYYGMFMHIIVVIVDMFYCSIKNYGDDFKWFSIAKYSYIMVMVSTLSGVAQYKILYDQAELTNTSSCVMNTISKSCPVGMFDYIQWGFQIFLITGVLATWISPAHESITTEGTSAILLTYIAAGQDIADFFANTSADNIKIFPDMVNGIIIMTFFSSIQFSLTLAARRFNSEGKKGVLDYILGNESWNILLICLTQDLPFLIIRLTLMLDPIYKISSSGDYTFMFFLIKSAILVALEVYRFLVLLREECVNENKIRSE